MGAEPHVASKATIGHGVVGEMAAATLKRQGSMKSLLSAHSPLLEMAMRVSPI